MRKIIRPQLAGDRQLEVLKDLNGALVLKIREEAVLLPPREAHDLAVLLLQESGIGVVRDPKRSADLAGKQLGAGLKIDFQN